MTIGFIGFGNMAQAIARGIERQREALGARMVAYNPTRAKIEAFPGSVEPLDTPLAVAQRSDYLFLCVKPQVLGEAAPAFRDGIRPGTVIVSILAGVSAQKIADALHTGCPVVRVMPNTPLLLGKGTSAIARPAGIPDEQYAVVLGIFRAIGSAYEIPADKFDEIVPVNGSSPALIYHLARLVARNAQANGLCFETALAMFADTLAGSAAMIRESGIPVDELVGMVCSKGGTTLAMLDRLAEHGFDGAVDDALNRCIERSRELGRGE